MYLGDIARANLAAMVLVIVGGLLYTLGSVAYATKRPNPVPGVFGFHDIFHAATALGVAMRLDGSPAACARPARPALSLRSGGR